MRIRGCLHYKRKMAACLQAVTSTNTPVILLYDSKASHASGKPLSKVIEDVALAGLCPLGRIARHVSEAVKEGSGDVSDVPVKQGGVKQI